VPHIIAMLHTPTKLPASIRRKYDAVRERCVQDLLRRYPGEGVVTLPAGQVITRAEYLKRTLPSVLLTCNWWLEDEKDL